MPKIPKRFLNDPLISTILASTIQEFNFEEQTVIYLYCSVNLSVEEIKDATELPILYITSTLILFAERLCFKLGVFEEAIYDTNNRVSVNELFELRYVKEMQEHEFDKRHTKWIAENRNKVF